MSKRLTTTRVTIHSKGNVPGRHFKNPVHEVAIELVGIILPSWLKVVIYCCNVEYVDFKEHNN